MSEEKVTSTESTEQEVSTEVVDTPEANPDKERAIAQGWKPKEEYVGEPDKWVDYEEFNRRAPFFEAISKANKKVKHLEEQLQALADHHNKTAEREYQKAREDLLAEKRLAAKEHDLERVIEIDEHLDKLDKTPPVKATASNTPPELVAFAEQNEWYGRDKVLTAFANGVGADIERANPNLSVAEVLRKVKEEVMENFPQKFAKPQTATSVVPSRPGPNTTVGKKKGITYNDLPEEAKLIYNRLVKTPRNPHGILSSEQYLKEYAANSGLTYEDN